MKTRGVQFLAEHPLLAVFVGYIAGVFAFTYVDDRVKVKRLARSVTDDLDKQWQAIVARRKSITEEVAEMTDIMDGE